MYYIKVQNHCQLIRGKVRKRKELHGTFFVEFFYGFCLILRAVCTAVAVFYAKSL